MGLEQQGQGKGVKLEALLITQSIYDNDSNNPKFIPLIFADDRYEDIPEPLRAVTHYNVDQESRYLNLYRYLTDQPKVIKRPLGQPLQLSPNSTVDVVRPAYAPGGKTKPDDCCYLNRDADQQVIDLAAASGVARF